MSTNQELPPPIDEVREERQIHHLQTNILAPEKSPRPGRQRKPAHTDERISPDPKKGEKT
jgi:hypothetical protein